MILFKVLQKQIEYQGCPIVIRQIGSNAFEFITCIKNQIYSSHIVAKKGFFKLNYTQKQISDITQYMIAMAQTTIETVLKGGSAKLNNELEKKPIVSPYHQKGGV